MKKHLGEEWEATDGIITDLEKKEARNGGQRRDLLMGQKFNSAL